MPIFTLIHPSKEFSGFAGGVDFSAGKGSTSDINDAFGLSKVAGCRLFVKDQEVRIKEAKQMEADPSFPGKQRESSVTRLEAEPIAEQKTEGAAEAVPLSVSLTPIEPEAPKRGRPRK
jgi:hypothetical protein